MTYEFTTYGGLVGYRVILTAPSSAELYLSTGADTWRLVTTLTHTRSGWRAADDRRLAPEVLEALRLHLPPPPSP
jgi:hypothetical protein